MSAVRSYTDEHIALAVVAGLRRRGVDVSTTQEAGMLGKPDPDQRALATTQRRVLASQDNDYLQLHAAEFVRIEACAMVDVTHEKSYKEYPLRCRIRVALDRATEQRLACGRR